MSGPETAAGLPTRDDLADTLCYLRRHADHPEERHCGPSWNEADRIVRCLAALNDSRRNRLTSAPSPVREPEGLDVERLARALPWVDLPGFGVLAYDPESKTLILTERIGRNEFGAAGIVARDCDSDVMLALLAAARREGWDAAFAVVIADAEKWHATQATLDALARLAATPERPADKAVEPMPYNDDPWVDGHDGGT